jgi:SH3-like domain-containing protein
VAPSPPGIGSPVPGGSPSPAPGGGTVIQPGASPSPGAATAAGVKLKVVNTEGQGANMRQRPSTTAPIVRTLPEGTSVEAIGDPTTAEGRAWRNVRDPNGATGWVATDLLAPE